MQRIRFKQFLLIGILYFSPWHSHAQSKNTIPNNQGSIAPIDTLKTRDSLASNHNDKIYTYTFELTKFDKPLTLKSETSVLDTNQNLAHFHTNPIFDNWYMNTGNTYSTVYPYLFQYQNNPGIKLGFEHLTYWKLNDSSIGYYYTTNPVTKLNYIMATKLEQNFETFHTNNINKNINFVFYWNKISAPGFFNGAENSHTRMESNFHWVSNNQTIQTEISYRFHKFNFFENGGILSDDLLQDSNYTQRRLVPTYFGSTANIRPSNNISSVFNLHKHNEINFAARKIFGEMQTTYQQDSSKIFKNIIPKYYIEFNGRYQVEKYQHTALNPDSLDYETFGYAIFQGQDSLNQKTRLRRWENQLIFAFQKNFKENALNFKTGIGTEMINFNNYSVSNLFNTYLLGHTHLKVKKSYISSDIKLFVLGNTIGDYVFSTCINTSIQKLKLSDVHILFENSLSSPSLLSQNWNTNLFKISNNLVSSFSQIMKFSGTIQKLKFSVFNYTFNNFPYLLSVNDSVSFTNYKSVMNIGQIILNYPVNLRKWKMENSINIQLYSQNYPINIPILLLSHKLYYQNSTFSNKLKFATGFQFDWTTKTKSAVYQPFFNRYSYNPNMLLNTNYINVIGYFNFAITRAKFFIMVNQLQQKIFNNNILNVTEINSKTPQYFYNPSNNFGIKFGIEWLMIN